MSPDIAMCSTEGCPLASSCYRKQATPDKWQSYSNFKYQDGECDAYWDINDEVKKRKKNPTAKQMRDIIRPWKPDITLKEIRDFLRLRPKRKGKK